MDSNDIYIVDGLNLFTSEIEKAIKERCEVEGLELNKENGKRITRVVFELRPCYNEYWLDYGKPMQKFLMSSEIIHNDNIGREVFPTLEIAFIK